MQHFFKDQRLLETQLFSFNDKKASMQGINKPSLLGGNSISSVPLVGIFRMETHCASVRIGGGKNLL